MSVGRRIFNARRDRGLTQEQLREELEKHGVTRSYGWLAGVETDRIKYLSPPIIKALSKALKKPVEYFEDSEDEPNISEAPAAYGGVPVLGVVSAETFNCAFEGTPESTLMLALPITGGRRVGAWRVSGDCMEPTAHDGDFVIVAEAAQVPHGRLAVVRLGGECTFKRIFHVGDHVELRPDNKRFKKISIKSGELQVVGEVVWVLKKP